MNGDLGQAGAAMAGSGVQGGGDLMMLMALGGYKPGTGAKGYTDALRKMESGNFEAGGVERLFGMVSGQVGGNKDLAGLMMKQMLGQRGIDVGLDAAISMASATGPNAEMQAALAAVAEDGGKPLENRARAFGDRAIQQREVATARGMRGGDEAFEVAATDRGILAELSAQGIALKQVAGYLKNIDLTMQKFYSSALPLSMPRPP